MIKLENTEVVGWEHAIRGMRNPMNSWEKSDSCFKCNDMECEDCFNYKNRVLTDEGWKCDDVAHSIGPNDHSLMMKLRNSGTDHRKFMRMITVYVDITAPLYWWKEFDTYKVGTVANSCSTMHKIYEKEFTMEDFSCEHLFDGDDWEVSPKTIIRYVIDELNQYRELYISCPKELAREKKDYWWQMIQLLPSSYNQKRTVMLNYEVLANVYKSRKNHKLDEWHVFCDWIEGLPYSELITGKEG